MTIEGERQPHPISPYGSEAYGFNLIASIVKMLYPEAVVSPSKYNFFVEYLLIYAVLQVEVGTKH